MSNKKIIYSLRIHIELQVMGFKYLTEMDHPTKEGFKCWIYEETEELLKAFDQILIGGRGDE